MNGKKGSKISNVGMILGDKEYTSRPYANSSAHCKWTLTRNKSTHSHPLPLIDLFLHFKYESYKMVYPITIWSQTYYT